jgi:PKD repeat protein
MGSESTSSVVVGKSREIVTMGMDAPPSARLAARTAAVFAASIVVGAGSLLTIAGGPAGASPGPPALPPHTTPSAGPVDQPAFHRPLGIQPPASAVTRATAAPRSPLLHAASSACSPLIPTPTPCGPLHYHTGPVVQTGAAVGKNTIYAVYWQPRSFATHFPANYQSVVDTYLRNVAATSGKPTNVYAAEQQYYETKTRVKQHIHYTVTYAGQITLTTAFPTNGCTPTNYYTTALGGATVCLTDTQEQVELNHYVTSIAPTAPVGYGHIYMMFFPPGVETCFTSTSRECSAAADKTAAYYCGYHSSMSAKATVLLYANMPFPTTNAPCNARPEAPNGTVNADTMISIVSHEQNETITDPRGNAWTATTGKYEDGDLCAYFYGTEAGPTGARYNQTVNGVHYLTQLEYSNEDHTTTRNGCIGSEELPTASFTGTLAPRAGSSDSFTGSASSDPDSATPLTYTWTWGDATTKSTGVNPSHTFTASGSYTVSLKVTDGDGWTGSMSKVVTVKATATPPSAPTGLHETAKTHTSVSLAWTASSSTGGSPITHYLVFKTGALVDTLGPSTLTGKVTGLTRATTYHFTVKAENGVGDSPASNTVAVTTTATPPSAPTGLHETAKTHTSVSLAWTASSSTGGSPITHYLVFKTGALVDTLGPSTLTGKVTGLTRATTYHFTVKAENGVGDSPASGALAVMTTATIPPPPPPLASSGYDLVGSDGGVFVLPTGNPGGFYGSLPGLGVHVNNIVGMVPTVNDRGYFLVGADGGVFSFGNAPFLGSLPGLGVTPAQPITGIVPTGTDGGYFLVGRDGGVYAFGNAPFLGSLPGDGIRANNIVGIAATPSGNGYWVVASTGTVYAFGAARQLGSATGSSSPVSAIAGTPTGGGYWIVTQNGAVDAFGNAAYFGSLPTLGVTPARPVIGVVHTTGTGGYWLIGSDGGVFAFGNAGFVGSLPGLGVSVDDIVGAVPTTG